MLWSFFLLLLKRWDNLTFSTQWCHGIRITFHPFSSSVILRNSKRSAFHHDLQTFEHTPVRTFLMWRGMPLCFFLCLLFMESCSSHGHSRCWNNSPDVQFLHFCFESLMRVGSIFLPRKLHNTSVNRAVHFSLTSSPPSFPEPCFTRQRLGSLDTAFQLPWQMWWVSFSCTSASSHIPGRTCQFVQYGSNRAKEAGEGRAEGKAFLSPCFTVEEQVYLIAF